MKHFETLLMTVLYKGAEKYLSDYLHSIEKQNTYDFDILILNDNVSPMISTKLPVQINEVNLSGNKSPSSIRYVGIKYAVDNNYKFLIFSDCDDFFSENRISLSSIELIENDFVYNEIDLVDEKSELIENNYLGRLINNKTTNSYKEVLDYNIFGLSHTGIRLDSLKNIFVPDNVIATDWWIFTLMLLNGAKGKFIDGTTTFYRQSTNNLVGMKKPLTAKRLSTGIKVKKIHYKKVLDYCKNHKLEFAIEDYSIKYQEMKELRAAVEDSEFRKRYIGTINAILNKIYKGWWSEILPINQWKTYAN